MPKIKPRFDWEPPIYECDHENEFGRDCRSLAQESVYEGKRYCEQHEPEDMPAEVAPPVYEVEVTRLVTFTVDVEALRLENYYGLEDGEDFDPQEAAESFIDEAVGVSIDNHATIQSIEPAPGEGTTATDLVKVGETFMSMLYAYVGLAKDDPKRPTWNQVAASQEAFIDSVPGLREQIVQPEEKENRMSYSLYTVYIPASPEAEKELGILPGSAIVGALGLPDPDLITVYYEGNKYGASNMHRFPDRVAQAAGRLRQRYPTVARQFGIEPSKLRAVATYNVDTREMDFGHEDHSVNENGESVLGGEAAENILALGDWIGRYHERE